MTQLFNLGPEWPSSGSGSWKWSKQGPTSGSDSTSFISSVYTGEPTEVGYTFWHAHRIKC